jgi:MOSC domain-containing protein YiiM
MTTLAPGDLPKDLQVLKAAVQHNQGGIGVYAAVTQSGRVHRGDMLTFE